jgi:hypothetical protein
VNRAQVDALLEHFGEQLLYAGLRSSAQAGQGPRARNAMASGRPPGANVRARLRAIVGRAPEVVVWLVGGSTGLQKIGAHLRYVSRRGALAIEDEHGEKSQGLAAVQELVQEWRLAGSKIPPLSGRREAHNIVLRMPVDGALEPFIDGVREFARAEFARHKFALVLHEPQTDPRCGHPHVHLLVRAEGRDGARLDPRSEDIVRWRQSFADRLLERGMRVAATRPVIRGQFGGDAKIWPPERSPGAEAGTRAPRDEQDVDRNREQHQNQDQDKWAAARNSRVQALRAWQAIAMTLAQSEEREDRALAVLALRYLRGLPLERQRPRDATASRMDRGMDRGMDREMDHRMDRGWDR